MNIKTILPLFITVIVLSGCAMSYQTINPISAFPVDSLTINQQGLLISCSSSDVLSAKNRWLVHKLEREGLVLVPVKIINNNEEPFAITSGTIDFINDYTPVEMVGSGNYLRNMRQKVWPNILLAPVAMVASIHREEVVMPDGMTGLREGFKLNLLSGAIALWGIINITRTVLANYKAKRDILRNDLYQKSIIPHSAEYGFICIKAKEIKQPMIRIKTTKRLN